MAKRFYPRVSTSQWSDAAVANPFPPEGTDQAGVHVGCVCVCWNFLLHSQLIQLFVAVPDDGFVRTQMKPVLGYKVLLTTPGFYRGWYDDAHQFRVELPHVNRFCTFTEASFKHVVIFRKCSFAWVAEFQEIFQFYRFY